ncbi:MAG: DUF262 domain-containing HNH endonuclease family protein [Candidatus Aenigmatarchaeota archaeon]
MEASKTNIGNIFNRSRILEIPHFQRSYVWEEPQWERFLEDMKYISKLNHPYFMGSVILKQQETPSSYKTGDMRSVVDGQQRLTTITLFFKALFLKNEIPDKFREIFQTHYGELILIHNYLDREVFEKILFDKELTDKDKEKQIYKCFDYFSNNITKDEIDANKLLGNVTFVGIDLSSQEDEQQIFDTINSLGVSLTTAELMKNFLFKDDIKAYINNWRNVFEKDDETNKYWEQKVTAGRNIRKNIDLFLESYLMIKIQEKEIKVNSEDKERYSIIDSVFNSYKQFIKKYELNKDKVIEEIREYAGIYRDNINPDIVGQDIDKNNYTDRLNLVIFSLDTATIIPYVLYICKQVQDSNEKNDIFKYLETYLMRRIIVKATTKNYNQLFRSSLINNEVNSLDKFKEIIEKKSDKINFMPSDEDVEKGFNESWLTNKQATGILYLIEKTIRSERNATELKYMNEYSLEHVMPKKWRNNWNKDVLTEEQKEKRDKILRTLGNLTIITKKLNSSIGDADWEIKKTGKSNHKGLNEYSNGIETFWKYLSKKNWNEDCIKERAEELCKLSVDKVWNLHGVLS